MSGQVTISAGPLVALVVVFSVIVTAVLQPLVEQEVLGSWPFLTRAMLSLAVRQLPADYREDIFAEWLGELDTLRDRPLSAFSFVLSLLLTTWRTVPNLSSSRRRGQPNSVVETKDTSSSRAQLSDLLSRVLRLAFGDGESRSSELTQALVAWGLIFGIWVPIQAFFTSWSVRTVMFLVTFLVVRKAWRALNGILAGSK